MANLIKGFDISSIQGIIDWQLIVSAGYQFVIIRCYVGNNGMDSLYATNVAGAKAAGLKVMAYNFVFPLPTTPTELSRSPGAQAQAHVTAANGELAACDLEWPVQADWAKWGVNAQFIVQWVTEYLETYETLSGIRPIIYTYPNFAQTINLPSAFGQKYKLWIASYENTPTIPAPWTDYVIWQNSGSGKLPNGVTVDTDFAKDLSLWDVQSNVISPTVDPTESTNSSDSNIAPVEPSEVPSTNIVSSVLSTLTNLFK